MLKKPGVLTKEHIDEVIDYVDDLQTVYDSAIDTVQRTVQIFALGKKNGDVPDSELNLAKVVEKAIKAARVAYSSRARISAEVDPNIHVYGYENNLITVFTNLIQNAAAYSLRYDKKAKLRIYNEGRDLVFYDDGVGIRSDRILTLFDRGVSYSKRGSGLGLYYCKIEMERIDGKIRCYSIEGEFTKFVLSFPDVPQGAKKSKTTKINK